MSAPTLKEDVWIPTVCNMCFCDCAIRVHRVDGVVVKIEGNPDSPVGEGRVCAKGAAGMMLLYDPHRITKPLKRTNPVKGVGIDPGWKEISWEEAYSLAAENIAEVRARNPRSLMYHFFIANTITGMWGFNLFLNVLGGQFVYSDICGAGIHNLSNFFNGTGNSMPDYDYTKLLIQFGMNAGTATRHGFNMTVRRWADARVKGARLVVVDPRMSASAEKADMWLPIRPGSDGALAMSLAYVLVHELGIYDRAFLKKYTNGTYLVDPDTKRFVKDPDSQKPFVWDLSDNTAKVFDDPSLKDVALDGAYTVNGKPCSTGFQLYTESLKKYTPEFAEKETTIPVAKIRAVAKEFGETANIGGTIVIDGKEFPYRPVAADCFSGVCRHKNGWHDIWAIQNLNTLVGAQNVPGGMVGFAPACNGFPETGRPKYYPGTWAPEHMLESCTMVLPFPDSLYQHAYTPLTYSNNDMSMFHIMPFNHNDPHFVYPCQLDPEPLKQQRAELLFCYAVNPLKSWGNHGEMEEYLKTYKYMIMCDYHLNDSSYFADLILPEATYLERYDFPPNGAMNHHTIGLLSTLWAYPIRQPAIASRDNAPSGMEIFLELAERLGVTAGLNATINFVYGLTGENELKSDKRYQLTEILDRIYKDWFGPKHDLEWFKKNGVLTWKRSADEVYLYPYTDARIPVYWDHMIEAGKNVAAAVKEADIPWDLSEYKPLAEWVPCKDHYVTKPGYDLHPIYYTNAWSVDSWTNENPWLQELNEQEPYAYFIEINAATAKAKGLKSGDRVKLLATNGYEIEGRLIVVEGIHPDVLAVAGGNWGNKSEFMPISKGKGYHLNNLIEVAGVKRLSNISANFDQCVKVKVVKV
jgi:anaerobic selenocysteine-containing dehydrogenase